MNTHGPYIVRAYRFQGAECCETEQEFDTLKDAKYRARRALSDAERVLTESTYRLGYATVENAAGKCVADYFNRVNVDSPTMAEIQEAHTEDEKAEMRGE